MPSDAANAATLARCRRASRLTTSLQHGSKSSRTTSWETIGPGGRHEQQHPATGGDWRPCGTAGWPLRGNSCNAVAHAVVLTFYQPTLLQLAKGDLLRPGTSLRR